MNNIHVPKIEKGYTNNKGVFFSNVQNFSFERNQNIFDYIGQAVAQSDGNKSLIFNNMQNPDIAFKLLKESLNYQENLDYQKLYIGNYTSVSLVDELIVQQNQIKNTKFPIGILTIDNYPVAQVIPYFKDSVVLMKYLESQEKFLLPINIYLDFLNNLKELYDNDVCYTDIHLGNVMINPITGKVDIIDFNDAEVYVMPACDSAYKLCQIHLEKMLNNANKALGIEETFFLNADNPIEDAIEKSLILSQRYR